MERYHETDVLRYAVAMESYELHFAPIECQYRTLKCRTDPLLIILAIQ
jgi:hypothetical protein